jgi:hypothetical protein
VFFSQQKSWRRLVGAVRYCRHLSVVAAQRREVLRGRYRLLLRG